LRRTPVVTILCGVKSVATTSPPRRSRDDAAKPGQSRGHAAKPGRVWSIDVIRGVVMVLMAVDHVRVYSGLPAGGPSPGIFFTRWITHFCAPVFVFLAGTSAFLHGQTFGDTSKTARYLVIRGLVLIALELTVLRVAWTFNVRYSEYVLAGVIWMIGWCMVLLAALIRLPLRAIAAFGLIVISAHNLIDFIPPTTVQPWRAAWLWQFVYFGGFFKTDDGGSVVAVLYSIVPWIGVMAAGYAFGGILIRERAERHRLCLIMGTLTIAVFVVLRGIDLYGDPRPWHTIQGGQTMPALLRFLNTTKYPASLLFLAMTLGPAIALIPLADRARGAIGNMLAVFGRVPMFYYLLHIPVIHAAALVVSLIREGSINGWLFANHPMMPPPPPAGYTWTLPLLYAVFLIVVGLLYVPCRWYASAKNKSQSRWLL
jgi:uncharacterized membrane protein